MLTATVVVMTVMGCGDGAVYCSPVSGPERVWTSQNACDRAIPGVLRLSMHMPYPVIAARCGTEGMGDAPKVVIAAATNVPFKAVRIEPAVKILRGDDVPVVDHGNPSAAKVLIDSARSGFEIVSRSATASYSVVRHGTRASYGALHDGLISSTDSTARVAQRAVDILYDLVD